jgi:hypothetical protein
MVGEAVRLAHLSGLRLFDYFDGLSCCICRNFAQF